MLGFRPKARLYLANPLLEFSLKYRRNEGLDDKSILRSIEIISDTMTVIPFYI